MRIALIHPRLQRVGGLETRLFNYINYFTKSGHEVHLIVSKIDPQVEIPDSVVIHFVNLKIIPKPIRLWFFNKGIAKVMKKEKFDVSLSLGRTSNQQMVLCPGTHLGYLEALNKTVKSPVDRMNIYLDKLAFRDSKLVLAASQKIKDELIQLAHVPEDKIRILHPPTDTSKFNQSGLARKSEWREKYGLSKTKKSLLFVTTGNHLKGYDFLLKLMAELQDHPIELVIAGIKPVHSELKNVKYLGYAEQVNELMWAADALVHPAIYEAYAQVVSEALFCGLPVIVSDRIGAKSVVTATEGIVVNGFEQEDWKAAIHNVLTKDWSISPGFVKENELTVEQHCEGILALGKQF